MVLRLLAATGLAALCACATVARPDAPLPHVGADPNRPPSAVFTVGTDSVQMLHGGDVTFTELRGLVDSARRRVELEMYEFGRADMAQALIRAHQRAVDVTVIVDPSVDVTAATAETLRSAGIDVVDYPVRKLMIDHAKLLIVDSSVAVVGGINWGAGSQLNHDVDAIVRGPAVHNLERIFDRDLVTSGRFVTVPDAVADTAVQVASTLPASDIHPLALGLVNGARKTLDLELYVLTDPVVVTAIVGAHRRGVAVRVLLDPEQRPSDAAAAALRGAGIAVRLYRSSGEKLHAKFAVADGRAVVFGSANWTISGFEHNHEIDVAVRDSPALAADFEAAVNADWSASA